MVYFIKENNPNCHDVLYSPVERLDNEKVGLAVKRLNSLISESSLEIIDNSIIGLSFINMHELHLNGHGVGKTTSIFVKRLRSILDSGSAKQKLKRVHPKMNTF